MTEYVFAPPDLVQDVDWSDPSIWSGGVVPATSDADVVLPEIYQLGNGPSSANAYPYFVALSAAESYAIDTISIDANQLTLSGALSTAGSVSLQGSGEIDLSGGALSFSALGNGGEGIQGQGTVTSADAISNSGSFVGAGLTISARSLQNTGSLTGTVGGLTVHAEGSGGSLSDGTLAGGTYTASSDNIVSPGPGGMLDLDMGGLITRDDATINLGSEAERYEPVGTDIIESVDPSSAQTLPLQQTLQQIDIGGSLNLIFQSYDTTGVLTVAGGLTLSDNASFSAAQLVVAPGGDISGNGTIAGPIVDDGTITANAPEIGAATLNVAGPVGGSGTLVIGADPELEDHSEYARNGIYTLELGGAVSVDVLFADGAGTLMLDDPREFTGTITPGATQYITDSSGTAAGAPTINNQIELAGVSLDAITCTSYTGNAAGGVLTIVAGGVTQTLRFAGDFTTNSFGLFAGPQNTPSASPSLDIAVTPVPAAPTLGLTLSSGGSAASAIVNTGTPYLTGSVPAGSTVTLSADGGIAEGSPPSAADPGDTAGTYNVVLTTALAPGTHQVTAVATNQAGSTADTASLLVLPDPVDGITTAASVGSARIAALLDQGARMQFVAGTEAIQLTDGTLSVGTGTDQALVQRLYEDLLGRGGDTMGLVRFTSQIATAGAVSVAAAILDSPEFQHLHGTPPVSATTLW